MQISDFKNKHKNEIVFIVGSSPSVRHLNIDLLKNYVVMVVNGGIAKVPDARYMVSDDRDILYWSYFDIIRKSDCICLFYEEKFKNDKKQLPIDRTAFYRHKSWFSSPDIYNLPDGLRLTKDITRIVGSRTSTGSAVHLAYCIGAKVIVLLGNDCQLSKDKYQYRYFWQFPGEQKQFRIKGREFNSKNQNRGFSEKSFVEYWNYFAEANKDILGKEVDIIDASDSCLNCFPKMSIKEILEKYRR